MKRNGQITLGYVLGKQHLSLDFGSNRRRVNLILRWRQDAPQDPLRGVYLNVYPMTKASWHRRVVLREQS